MPHKGDLIFKESFSDIFYVGPKRGLITVHPEMSPFEYDILPTGRYLVFGIHPDQGSFHFVIERNDMNVWYSLQRPAYMSSPFITWIGERVDRMRK